MSNDKSLNGAEPPRRPSDYYLSAPVEMPTREQMTVKLVPFHQVVKWDEARSDEQFWLSVVFLLIGAVLGIIAEWCVSDPITITRASAIVLFVFLALGVLTGFMAWFRYRARAERMRKEIAERGETLSDMINGMLASPYDQVRQPKVMNEHLQGKFHALRRIKAVVDDIPRGLESGELLERLKTDPSFRGRLTSRLVRLFGLRNEFIPYLEPEFMELIDTQFQQFYVIQTGTYTFREEKLKEFIAFMEQLSLLVLSMEERLMQEYEKSLK